MTPQQSRAATATLVALLAPITLVMAQSSEQRVSMKSLPKPVQQTVLKQSKGAKLVGLAKEIDAGQTFYEASFRVKGHNRDVLIDPTGLVVEIEEEVALASLPTEVKATIEKNAGKAKIRSVESISKNDVVVAYEAQVSAQRKSIEIKVAPDGKLMSIEDEDEEKPASKKP